MGIITNDKNKGCFNIWLKNIFEGRREIKGRQVWFLLVIMSLLLVTFPRFNRSDFGPIKMFTGDTSIFNDSEEYIAYVKYFRKEITYNDLMLPFAYRPFVPFIASFLPFGPMTSINIINLASLLISLFILYRLLIICGISLNYSIGGCFMFVLSFPVFYYGTVGYTDPVLILFLLLGTYFTITERTTYTIITVIIGCLVKETIIIIIPVFFLYKYLRGKSWKLSLVILLISYLGVMWMVRSIYIDKGHVMWLPSFNILKGNIVRLRSWVSTILTFGVPGFLFLILTIKHGWRVILSIKPIFYSLLIGFFFSLILTLYSALSAYLDGRFVWTSYPFSIPLSLLILMSNRKFNIKEDEI